MKLISHFLLILWSLLLAGCASTIRSDVRVFHEWPSDLADKSFVFDVPASHQANAQYAVWLDILRGELVRLGFTEAAGGAAARLKVVMHYSTAPIEVKFLQPVYADPFWAGPYRYNPFWHHRHRYYPAWGYYYDPFWYGPPVIYRETIDQRYQHQLQMTITQSADGKKLYEVSVDNQSSRKTPLTAVMPFMIKSAFAQFPGKSGTSYHVDYKAQE